MAAKSIGKVLENSRILLIIGWFVFITWIVICIYPMMMGTNTQGSSCDTYSWQKGQIYQWIWGKQPCVYTSEFLFGYVFYMQLYLLYDYVRRKIVGFNPNIFWRMAEVGVWFALNWGYLLWLTATDYGTLDRTMVWTSLAGTLLFFVPIILLATIMRFLSNRAVLWTFFGLLFAYCGLVFYAAIKQ